MSYDIWLEIDTGGEEAVSLYDWSPTYNYGPMFREAFGGHIRDLWDGKQASEIVENVQAGLRSLQEKPDHFRQFDPENGWGTYDDLMDTTHQWRKVSIVEEFLDALAKHPKATVRVT